MHREGSSHRELSPQLSLERTQASRTYRNIGFFFLIRSSVLELWLLDLAGWTASPAAALALCEHIPQTPYQLAVVGCVCIGATGAAATRRDRTAHIIAHIAHAHSAQRTA